MWSSRRQGFAAAWSLVALVLVLVLVVNGQCAVAIRRPFSERRDGDALAKLMEDANQSSSGVNEYFFHHLHKDGQWPMLASHALRVDSASLSDVETSRGVLLATPHGAPSTLFATTVEAANETSMEHLPPTPYAHLLPMLTQKHYLSEDTPLPNSTTNSRAARLSGTRHWPYYFRYAQFEAIANKDMHTQQLCGVVQLDRGSYGIESFGVDEVLVLVYNDWAGHAEHALTLAEDFARLHLPMHEFGAKDTEETQLRDSRQAVRAALRGITPAPTLAGAAAGAFVDALRSLTATATDADTHAHDAQALSEPLPDICLAPNAMLWLSATRATSADRLPMQVIAAVRQRQFGSSWSGAVFAGLYRSLYILDPARVTPYFAVVRDGVLTPVALPVTADTTLTDLRRLVVQQSPSTFALPSAEHLLRLASHYGRFAVAMPFDGPETAPWNTTFHQAFVAIRAALPTFALTEAERQRLPWDRMVALPRTQLAVPDAALLLPDLSEWGMENVLDGLGYATGASGAASATAPSSAGQDAARATPAPVCVRLVEAAVRHAGAALVSTADALGWRWQDVCVPGPSPGRVKQRLWDRVVGAQLRDAVLEAAVGQTRVPDIRNGVDFRQTMRRLFRASPLLDTIAVVLDDADGACGDAARRHVFARASASSENQDVSVVVVDGAAPALQTELWTAAEAAMRRRHGALPRPVPYDPLLTALGAVVPSTCRALLATADGALYAWPPAPASTVSEQETATGATEPVVWPLEGPSQSALHAALEQLDARLAAAPAAEAPTGELRSERDLTAPHGTGWQVVLPAGLTHPVLMLDVSSTRGTTGDATTTTRLEVVALTDRSCGLCANVLKSLWLLRTCEAPVAELDLRDLWLQRRGTVPVTTPAHNNGAQDATPLMRSLRAHVATHLETLRPPRWYIANGTHVLMSFPSSGYVEKSSWDVPVVEWMRLMGLPDADADALHRCAQARLAKEVGRRGRFRGAFYEERAAAATGAVSSADEDVDDDGDL